MTRGDCVTNVLNILKRSDCSSDLATTFLGQGMSRVQRLLRVPSMERVVYVNALLAPVTSMELAPDTLQIIDVLANGNPLDKLAYRQMQQKSYCEVGPDGAWPIGQPWAYSRIGAQLFFLPALAVNGQAMVVYYGTFSDLPTDADSNEATSGFPDLCVYAALSFAGDYFRHDETATWESRFQALLVETQDQATQLDANGGSEAVQSAYGEC